MPMDTKKFPTLAQTDARKKATKSMRSAFNAKADDEEEEKPAPVGHTKLDDEQEDTFAKRIAASIKRRRGQ